MKKSYSHRNIKSFYLFLFLLFIVFLPSKAQNYYYAQWSRNLIAGDNIFDISTGTSHTNWTSGIYAVTSELLANSVSVNVGTENVSVQVKKISRSQFRITSASAISNAYITAQYPGIFVVCNPPILTSISRNGTTVTYYWDNNGTNTGTLSLDWSSDGINWSSTGAGGAVSPRTATIPNTYPMYYRVNAYQSTCPSMYSNVLSSTGCNTPSLISAVRNTFNPSIITFTWNNNGSTFDNVTIEYSTNSGGTWTQTCSENNATSPRTCTGLPASAILVRIRATGIGCNVVSNSISLNTDRYTVNTQALGNYFTSPNTPTSNSCRTICATWGETNFQCGVADINNVGIGTQLYIRNNTQDWVPATHANCNMYAPTTSGLCNQIGTGIKWIRFIDINSLKIWNVDYNSGVITGINSNCPN